MLVAVAVLSSSATTTTNARHTELRALHFNRPTTAALGLPGR